MIVGVCGFGGTGSSAAKDFIKEFENVQTIDRAEAMFAFKVDGLQDLEYHLMKQYSRHMSGDAALNRFIRQSKYAKMPIVKKIYLNPKQYKKDTIEFVEKITQVKYKGIENVDYENGPNLNCFLKLISKKIIGKCLEKITKKTYKGWPFRTIRVSIKPENFYDASKEYMNKILLNAGADFNKIIILDQPFEGNNPTQSFPFFNDAYAIVIDRDPRDLYMAASYQWPDGQFMPRQNVEKFVEYYKRIRENIDYSKDTDRVLRIRLEDMIFNYEKTTKKIMNFLNLKEENHINPKKFFNPLRSIKGSQIYKKIPGHEEEIKYIEENLKEYLFNFDKYELSKLNTEINKGFKWDENV